MVGGGFTQRAAVVSVTLLDSGYIEQRLIDKNGQQFVLILRPVNDTLARVSVLVRQSIDYDVFSTGIGTAVLNVTLADGAEAIDYAVPVGAPHTLQ